MVKTDKIRNIILRITEDEIKSLYAKGFFSMWLSNHWILMWFYKQFGHEYKYFWSIEYDVRISGDSSKIWTHPSQYDFLYVLGNYRNSKNIYNNYYVGNKLLESEKYYGYLQIARYSSAALAYLDECFCGGENGQDELIIFSLLNRGGFTKSKKFLQKLIRGIWTWQNNVSFQNRQIYEKLESKKHNNVYIFHPIK